MVLKARKKQKEELTNLQKRYLNIVVNEYYGFVPHGEQTRIAKRLGCSRKYLYDLDRGEHPIYTRERDRQIQALIPFLDPMQMMAALQILYDDKIRSRKAKGLDMTGKDPVDIIDQARRIQQGQSKFSSPRQQNILDQSSTTNINLVNLSDEELSTLAGGITDWIRNINVKQLETAGRIVDGTAKYAVINPAGSGQPSGIENASEGNRSGESTTENTEGIHQAEE